MPDRLEGPSGSPLKDLSRVIGLNFLKELPGRAGQPEEKSVIRSSLFTYGRAH